MLFLAYVTISPLLTLLLGIQTKSAAADIWPTRLFTSYMRIKYGLRIGIKTGRCFRVFRENSDKFEWYLRPRPIPKHVQELRYRSSFDNPEINVEQSIIGIRHNRLLSQAEAEA